MIGLVLVVLVVYCKLLNYPMVLCFTRYGGMRHGEAGVMVGFWTVCGLDCSAVMCVSRRLGFVDLFS